MISDNRILSESNVDHVVKKYTVNNSKYTYLEYLESQSTDYNNGSYIDLGFPLKKDSYIEVEIELVNDTSSSNGNFGFFGDRKSNNQGSTAFYFYYNKNNTRLIFNCFGTQIAKQFNPLKKFIFKYDYGKYYIDGELIHDFGTGSQVSDSKCYIFCVRTGNEIRPCSCSRLYSFKLKDSEHDINLLPAKKNSDGEFGLYDNTSDVFYTNSGSYQFIAGLNLINSNEFIPKRLDYLESTQTQYLDLGIHTTGNSRIHIICSPTKTGTSSGNYAMFFGSSYPDHLTGHELYVWEVNTGILSIRASYFGQIADGSNVINVGDILDIDFNKNHLTIFRNGINIMDITYAYSSNTSSGMLQLFRIARETFLGNVRIYNAQIYENDILLYDLVSVFDGNPAMLDKKSRKCYYNLGTGNFIQGPETSVEYSSTKPATLKTLAEATIYPEKDLYLNKQIDAGILKTFLEKIEYYAKLPEVKSVYTNE